MTTLIDASKHLPVEAVRGRDRSMGALLIDLGKLKPDEAERVLRHSKERNLRFGDAAISLGLVNAADIEQVLARQFDYPYLMPGQSKVSAEVVAAWSPFSKQVEALRAIRSQLLLRWFTGEQEKRALALVSAAQGDGRSHLAANLAVVFSQLGERTLLLDANLRSPRQHDLFALENGVGFSSILADRAGIEAIQRVPAFVDLSVLTSGPTPPNPLELLGRSAFANLMIELKSQFDVIIVDAPAAEAGSDFQLICQKTGAAILIARKDRTAVDSCQALSDAVGAASAQLIGSVLTDF